VSGLSTLTLPCLGSYHARDPFGAGQSPRAQEYVEARQEVKMARGRWEHPAGLCRRRWRLRSSPLVARPAIFGECLTQNIR
jgi:hypothetical protein